MTPGAPQPKCARITVRAESADGTTMVLEAAEPDSVTHEDDQPLPNIVFRRGGAGWDRFSPPVFTLRITPSEDHPLTMRREPARDRGDLEMWGAFLGEFLRAGVADPGVLALCARRAVAVARRDRAAREGSTARTFAPGDAIPAGVTCGYDADGAVWDRRGRWWKVRGYNPAVHEAGAADMHSGTTLLEEFGPLTEIPPAA